MALMAALLLVPGAKAQYHLDSKSGFAFDKYVTSKNPDEHGEYTLHIETFATGEVKVEKKAIPSDIVLVLDASGSMKSNKMVHPTLRIEDSNTTWMYSSSGINSAVTNTACIFVKYPDDATGKYYRVQNGHAKVNGSTSYNDHWLYFTIPADDATGAAAQTKYIYGSYSASDISQYIHDDKAPAGTYAAQNTVIYTGKLYRYPQRTEALKAAVKLFISKINENDSTDVQPFMEADAQGRRVGNQISIVQYHGDSKSQSIKSKEGDSNTKPLIGFTPVKDHVSDLYAATDRVAASSNTPHDAGLKVAQLLLEDLNTNYKAFEGKTRKRYRTVVFFTDGQPAGGNGATKIKQYSLQISNAMKMHNADDKLNQEVKIFSIAFNPRHGSGSEDDKGFLEHVSSNYAADCAMDAEFNLSGTPMPADEQNFYMDAGDPNMDIDSIFEAIAESVSGGGSEYDTIPLAAVDMVSSSFELPKNADPSRVKVYTAQCLGLTGETITVDGEQHKVLAFAEPVLATGRDSVKIWVYLPKLGSDGKPMKDELGKEIYEWKEDTRDIDDVLSVEMDKTDKTVSIKGFDFEALWCGHDEKHQNVEYYDDTDPNYGYHVPGYRGFKLIFEFPIVVEDGATGGPNVVTNLASSGVYQTDPDTGERTGLPIVKYPIPDLPIPINLVIEKHGLLPGESASFTILKKYVNPTDPDNNPYLPYNRVTLKGTEDGSPAVEKLLNLDPSFYYKLLEEGWSWSYSNQAQDLTTETVTDNKFVIENTYDNPDVKHAEASKRNVMEKTTSSTTTP